MSPWLTLAGVANLLMLREEQRIEQQVSEQAPGPRQTTRRTPDSPPTQSSLVMEQE